MSCPGQTLIDEHLAGLDDSQLHQLLAEAVNDCKEAAAELNSSEWHAACFAAAVVYAQELNKRGFYRHPHHGPEIADTFKETPNG